MDTNDGQGDLQSGATESLFSSEQQDISVSRDQKMLNPAVIVAVFAVAAISLFLWLNDNRTAHAETLTPKTSSSASMASAPPPLDLSGISSNNQNQPAPFTGFPAQVGLGNAGVEKTQAQYAEANSSAQPALTASPAMVVDLSAPRADGSQTAQSNSFSSGAGGADDPSAAGSKGNSLNESEQFARRVENEAPERAFATNMRNLSDTAPQGTIIPGVLETAINSDLPGYTRAIVSRDVMSFDGRKVLIPRSSRLIGEYKSAGAIGQSRVFIIWTRVIRPDGATIQIGSAGTDALGRGGLEGDVDRHFFQRFGGSILLSVLNAGVNAASSQPSTQITIGSPAAAAGLVGNIVQGDKIPPTIKVPQGEAVRIFVARDLDFSRVGSLQ